MKHYNQLTHEQRYQIEALMKAGNQQKVIADIIGVCPSTISRELKRKHGSAWLSSPRSAYQDLGAKTSSA